MSRWLYLSYPINARTPVYGGGEAFSSVTIRSIKNGDACNTEKWIMPNHIGTHIDFPRHFVDDGLTGLDYSAEFWIFHSIILLDISPVLPGTLIMPDKLNADVIRTNTELLLIKTGFSSLRKTPRYWQENPAFSPDIASFLRKQCPKLRVVGFDAISLSSWTNRDLGRKAHRRFLDHSFPLLLLEDMNLSEIFETTDFFQVVVAPLSVLNTDGAPCTVFAEVAE